MIEHPDSEKRARINLQIWRAVTGLIVIGCFVGMVSELNQEEQYNALLQDYIGGPKMGDVLLLAGIGAVAAFACWKAHRALNSD